MLQELHISNLAIIDDQSISFGPGLNVLTGETGSGKSIVLSAMELLLGGRGSTQLIRDQADALEVQGIFDLADLPDSVIEELPEIARGEQICVSRSLSRTGKGKVFINGRLATVAVLESVARSLISVCGQNQHVRLLVPQYHRELLDGFGGLEAKLKGYQGAFEEWRNLSHELATVLRDDGARAQRRSDLEAIVTDLSPLKIRAGERVELEAAVKRMASAENLIAGGQAVLELLRGEESISDRISTISGRLQELARLDSGIASIVGSFQALRTELSEATQDLERYVARVSVDDRLLESMRDRLAEIARLERKYKVSDSGLVELLRSAQAELAALSDSDGVGALHARCDAARLTVEEQADKLTKVRSEAAKRLAKAARVELATVALGDSRLEAKITPTELGPWGRDQVELEIATNPGESLKPLKLVASGGELARITLVLKTLLRERSGINVLVFDEVDTGISGGVARAVGLKLKSLAGRSQVICVTHLAQVASLADTHLLVSKINNKGAKGRATVKISTIKGDMQVDEIARMLAGYTITEAARASARELLTS